MTENSPPVNLADFHGGGTGCGKELDISKAVAEVSEGKQVMDDAKKIYGEGKALEYMVETCQGLHTGDIIPIRAFILSYASTRVRSGNGIHITMKGERASGKTHCATTVLEILPPIDTLPPASYSDKSLFYMSKDNKLHRGMVLHVDDQTPTQVWEEINKARMSDFWKPFYHHTVGKDRGAEELYIPEAVVSWNTIVTDVTDEQSQSRVLTVKADETMEQRDAVYDIRCDKAEHPKNVIENTHRRDVCRTMWMLMPKDGVYVAIPFAHRIMYDKGDETANRTVDIFFTLIQCVSYMRAPIRHVDKDGCIISEEDDYRAAEEIMNQSLDIRLVDLTETQKLLLKWLYDSVKEFVKKKGKMIEERTYGVPISLEHVGLFDMSNYEGTLNRFLEFSGKKFGERRWLDLLHGRERRDRNYTEPGLDTVPGIRLFEQYQGGSNHWMLEFNTDIYDLMRNDMESGIHHFYLKPSDENPDETPSEPS